MFSVFPPSPHKITRGFCKSLLKAHRYSCYPMRLQAGEEPFVWQDSAFLLAGLIMTSRSAHAASTAQHLKLRVDLHQHVPGVVWYGLLLVGVLQKGL